MSRPLSISDPLPSPSADNQFEQPSDVFSRNGFGFSGRGEAMNKPVCKICKRNVTRRVNRQGFLQRVVFYKLGLAPWECVFCRKPFLAAR
jgi:hypothetical protein